MSTTTERWCIWCGPTLLAVFFIGFWPIARFMPPTAPGIAPEAVARMYVEHANSIRIGLLMGLFAIFFFIPWASALVVALRRIEGTSTPMAYTQLATAVTLPIVFLLPMMAWLIASYRPETRSAEITSTLHDAGWLLFVVVVFPGPPLMLSAAIPILRDRGERPVFPRWAAYFSIWAEFLYMPGAFAVFFKDGPVAWNGIFAFWMPLMTFALWMLVMSKVMLDALNRREPVVDRGEVVDQDQGDVTSR